MRTDPQAVVAVGENAYAAAVAVFRVPVVPVLVKTLPPGARAGLSLFVAPDLFLRQILALSPQVRTVHLIHRADAPPAPIDDARAAARVHGLRLDTVAVASIRDVARAVETVLGHAGPSEAVWFQRGVVGMNADVLVPAIVRLSWDNKVPVFDEEAEYVARGMLFALTHDYLELGRAAGAIVGGGDARAGIAYAPSAKRILNRRTARAIGIAVKPAQEAAFDYVYE